MSHLRKIMKSPILGQIEPKITRILLIEDNPGDARLVKEMLKEAGKGKLSSFSLEHTTRVSEGLSLLGQENFEIILLDLSLPDGFGLGMVSQVCATFPHLPVIILTSLDDETMAIQAVQQGLRTIW